MRVKVLAQRGLIITTAFLAAIAGGSWASWQIFSGPDRDMVEDEQYLIAEATPGVVEQSLQLNTSTNWSSADSLATQASGTVTEVLHPGGDEASAGDILFTVDLKPVLAAEGAVPSFRTLSEGIEGEDVAQLQQFLVEEGYFDRAIDGRFDYHLRWAVREWQQDLGMEVTGTVDPGMFLFLPELPTRVSLAKEFKVGALIAPGAVAIDLLPDSPIFTIELSNRQAHMVEPGMSVKIRSPASTWQAVIRDIQLNENQTFVANLQAAEDGSICGDECYEISLGEPTLLSSTIYTVPAINGITVPAAAVTTDAEGQTAVIAEGGQPIPVEVLAGAQGTVVVDGLDAGTRVRVPAGGAQ